MLLSVRLQTYNHQDFIEQALQGIEDQETSFNFEVVIGDDFSTDNNVKLIKKFISNSKNSKIEYKLLDRKEGDAYWKQRQKKGRLCNFINILENCKGKYIALLDGDDYWTDPLKLQKQVDFLEANAEYSICFHEVDVLKNEVLEADDISVNIPETTTILNLAKRNYMHTCSVVYRNNGLDTLSKYFKEALVGDYFLHLLNARTGNIKCINSKMGVYRKHEKSVWSSKSQKEQNLLWVSFLKKIKPHFNTDVRKILDAQICSVLNVSVQKKEPKIKTKTNFIHKIKKLFKAI
ncbi:glycosyltransferase [Gaetbulibacter sp. M235]|uniref:glycosyltransferase n=1 Tax=Gaetbulibacter sp. M235 TaxID=3126510 RepID=UPI00374E9372